jgi:hypothetical protein
VAKEKNVSEELVAPPKAGELAVYDYGDDRGGGFEGTSQADYAIPFLNLLQAMSPQCTRGKPEYNESFRPGDMFNSVTGEIFKGESGVIIVPCMRDYKTVEWRPRDKGAGMVAVHHPEDPIVKKARNDAKEFGDWKTPEGNELVDTFYLYCLMLRDVDAEMPDELPVVIPFTSTKIKKYRAAMSKWRAIKRSPPLWAIRARLRAVPDQNNKGSFFNYDLSPARGSSYEECLLNPQGSVFQAGAEFARQVQAGILKPDYSSQTGSGGSDGANQTVF